MGPPTKYAKSGDVHIAYQVVGEGPFDLVFSPSPVSNLEVSWEWPPFARFLNRLASFSRLILFDKRGTGLSDRVTDAATLEERMDDVRAVMDAAGSERAVLFGSSEGGPMALLFTAMYPERVSALVLYGSYAKSMNTDNYHSGVDPELFELGLPMIEAEWGNCALLDVFCPSMRDDEAFRAWHGRFERQSASPGAAVAIQRLNAKLDVRPVLPSIKVPTLIIYRAGEFVAHVEGSKYLAQHIEGAQYVELPGADYHPYVGDQDAILDPIEEFLTGERRSARPARALAAILVADSSIAGIVESVAPDFDGVVGRTSAGSVIVRFDGPARATACAVALRAAAPVARIGMHVGEVEVHAGAYNGTGVDVASEVHGHAASGQILISRTLADILPGSDIDMVSIGARELGRDGRVWELFAVAPAKTAAPAEHAGVFRREGDVWLVGFDGASTRVRAMKGFADIATLLSRPGREVHVSELVGAAGRLDRPGTQSLLDPRALAEYRARLAELADDEAEAQMMNDPEREAKARAEREVLAQRLSADLRLGGTARAADDWVERARKTVRLRVANAIKRVETEHTPLANHLRSSIRTGTYCAYEPVEATSWSL